MAQFALYPATSRVYKLDPRLAQEQSVYLEPLACAMHAVDRADIQRQNTVVIAGIGSVGLCMVQAAAGASARAHHRSGDTTFLA